MEEKQELVSYSPQGLISQALAQGVPIETLERLMDLADRWESKQTKNAFTAAMSNFQRECPIIRKRKDGSKTKTGFVAFKYAPIEHILTEKNKDGKTVQDLISENGFSYIIKTPSFTPEAVTVDVEIRHLAGHSEISSVTMPLVTKTDIMSAPQVTAGTITLCKRYAFCNGFGIITGNPDLDGMKQPEKPKEAIPEPKAKNDPIIEKINACKTRKELDAIWPTLTDKQQPNYIGNFQTKAETFKKK